MNEQIKQIKQKIEEAKSSIAEFKAVRDRLKDEAKNNVPSVVPYHGEDITLSDSERLYLIGKINKEISNRCKNLIPLEIYVKMQAK